MLNTDLVEKKAMTTKNSKPSEKITENYLIKPALKIISKYNNGLNTSNLINLLRKELNPEGELIKKLKGRSDDKFSQLVRNLHSHRTLEGSGFVKFFDNKFFITSSGINFINAHKDLQEIKHSLDLPIQELEISVRAMNVLRNLNICFVSDLLDYSGNLIGTPNCGQKTKDQINELISKYKNKDLEKEMSDENISLLNKMKMENLCFPIDETTLGYFNLSVRSKNVLNINNIDYLGDIIFKETENKQISRSRNLGVKTMREIEKEILFKFGLSFSTRTTEWPPDDIGSKSKVALNRFIKEKCKFIDSTDNLINEIKKTLDEQELYIVLKRLEGKTLQEVANKYEVTRERIRQLEKQALNIISQRLQPVNEKFKSEFLDEINNAFIKNIVFTYKEFKNFLNKNLTSIKKLIFLFSLKKTSTAFYGKKFWIFLDNNFQRFGSYDSWFIKYKTKEQKIAFETIKEEVIKVANVFESYREILNNTPLPINYFSEKYKFKKENIILVTKVLNYNRYGSYIFSGYKFKRYFIKACNLHALTAGKRLFKVNKDLIEKYITTFSMQIRHRTIDVLDNLFPRLFTQLSYSSFVAIGHEVDLNDHIKNSYAIKEHRNQKDQGNLLEEKKKEYVFSKLKICEPTTSLDLGEFCKKDIYDVFEKFSHNSVGFYLRTLLNEARVKYVAVGYIASASFIEEESKKKIILSEKITKDIKHTRNYCHARKAKEPMNSYLFWNHQMEHAMCKYAQKYAKKDVFHSLLNVIEPEKWDQDDKVKSYWMKKKEDNAKFMIHPKKQRLLSLPLPDIIPLFKILINLEEKGFTNWFRANILKGVKLQYASLGTYSYVAILAFTSAVKEVESWTELLEIGEKFKDLKKVIYEHLRKGDIEWNKELRIKVSNLVVDGIKFNDVKSEEATEWIKDGKTETIFPPNLENKDKKKEMKKDEEIDEWKTKDPLSMLD